MALLRIKQDNQTVSLNIYHFNLTASKREINSSKLKFTRIVIKNSSISTSEKLRTQKMSSVEG